MKSDPSVLSILVSPKRFSPHAFNLFRNRMAASGALIMLASLCLPAHAQLGQWTWVGGSSTVTCDPNQTTTCSVLAVSGALGTPAAANAPGGRYEAASWTDSAGNFWLFGGNGTWPDAVSGDPNPFVATELNDLWQFNPSTKEWTWMGGDITGYPCDAPYSPTLEDGCSYEGLYTALGSLTAGDFSGSRFDAVTWSDQSNNLWLFGGSASFYNSAYEQVWNAPLNDVWEFNPSNGEWGWMAGNSGVTLCGSLTGNSFCPMPGAYGTLGVAAAGQFPGSRESGITWTDGSGNLWMFGGLGWDGGDAVPGGPPPAAHRGELNDLWEFNPSTLLWTWMGGAPLIPCVSIWDGSLCGVAGVYGTQGVAGAGNIPGGRDSAVSWTDLSGNFWLFGGVGLDSNGTVSAGMGNDLWEFSPSSSEWTWVSGSSTFNASTAPKGVYGTLGVPAAANVPGGRMGSVSWTDKLGKLWLFGGYGADSLGNVGYLNDFWRFDPETSEWMWVGGSSTMSAALYPYYSRLGVYGTRGTPGAGNAPGSRWYGRSWTDTSGNLWMFGGQGYDSNDVKGLLNDLWEYQPPIPAAPAITSAIETTFTSAVAGNFTVTATGFPIATISEAGTLPSGVTFTSNSNGTATLTGKSTAAGSYPITITASNGTAPNATQNFTLAVSSAGLTSPTPGSVLGTSNVQFTWTPNAGATQYSLWLGLSGPGSSSLYTSGWLTTTSATVPSLPAKGATVYARLYSTIGGKNQYIDYTFTEAGTPATMSTPSSGSTLGTSDVLFTWTAGYGVTQYQLWLGLSGAGSSGLYTSGWLPSTSITVPSLPGNGATVYARLYSTIDGKNQYNDYTFTEGESGVPATMTLPTTGSTLGTSDVQFTWTKGTNVTQYQLWLGTTGAGSSGLYTSGWLTTQSTTVPSLPAKGATVYARLYSTIGGKNQYNDYTYVEQ
jgi:N-acetylneuraminic acid mutarotase